MNGEDLFDDDVSKLFEVHLNVCNQVSAKKIGRIGGPFEINIRQLMQLRDVLKQNLKDQGFHLSSSNQLSVGNPGLDAKIISLRNLIQLVYGQVTLIDSILSL